MERVSAVWQTLCVRRLGCRPRRAHDRRCLLRCTLRLLENSTSLLRRRASQPLLDSTQEQPPRVQTRSAASQSPRRMIPDDASCLD